MINWQISQMKIPRLKFELNQTYLKIFLVLTILSIIGLYTVGDYGVTWDEWIEMDMVKWVEDFISQGKPIPRDSEYYGFIFNFAADQLYEFTHNYSFSRFAQDLSPLAQQPEHLLVFRHKMAVKHILIFLFSLLNYASVAGITAILAGLEYAWFAPIVLALFPQFWGHSFFNPKDIPFATMFTLATFLGACLVSYYLKAESEGIKLRIGVNKITLYSVLYGVILGLVTGVRIGAFLVIFFVIIAHLLTKFNFKSISGKLINFTPFYILMFLVWALVSILCYPASWHNPVQWFFAALDNFSKYSLWDNSTNFILFDGEYIKGSVVPWYYIIRLLTITIPILFSVTFIVGLGWILVKYKKFTESQRACIILVLLQIFVIPILVIIKQSTIYDGLRHFLFIIPGIAAICATILIWIYQKLPNQHLKIFALTFLIIQFSPVVIDMIALHPYQYTYFNRTYGGLSVAHKQQETDYWGLSLKEGMEWLNKNAQPQSNIVVAGPVFAAEIFAHPDLKFNMIDRDKFLSDKALKVDYYMAIPRYDYQKTLPECPIIYSVTRQNAPLTIVKQCQK